MEKEKLRKIIVWVIITNIFITATLGLSSINRIIEVIHQKIYLDEYKNGLIYITKEGCYFDGYNCTPNFESKFFDEIFEIPWKNGVSEDGLFDIVRFQAPAIPVWYRMRKDGSYEMIKKNYELGTLKFSPTKKISIIVWLFFFIWSLGIMYNIYLIKNFIKL